MKAFFEEYGRVIVTVLIILGIILVGYVIAGNGQNSAFGKFTTATVDSLSGQANDVLEKGSFNNWKLSNSKAQEIFAWGDDTVFRYNADSVNFVKGSVISENNPVGGKVKRVTVTHDFKKRSAGIFSAITDGKGSINNLQTGRKYNIYYYARGQGEWVVGPERGGADLINLTSRWQRIDKTFTADDNPHSAFIQYAAESGAKTGDYCDVTNVYMQEVK